MFGNLGSLGDMLKQAQALKDNIDKAKEEIANFECTGESGAGLVRITMNGKHEVRKVEIDPSLLGEDKEMLEDLVAAAINDASRVVTDNMTKRLEEATASMGLPPGFKPPF